MNVKELQILSEFLQKTVKNFDLPQNQEMFQKKQMSQINAQCSLDLDIQNQFDQLQKIIESKNKQIKNLTKEKEQLIQSNVQLQNQLKYQFIRDIFQEILTKTFCEITKKQTYFSLKKKESIRLNDVIKNSKEKLMQFKKNLMNSTKKKSTMNFQNQPKISSQYELYSSIQYGSQTSKKQKRDLQSNQNTETKKRIKNENKNVIQSEILDEKFDKQQQKDQFYRFSFSKRQVSSYCSSNEKKQKANQKTAEFENTNQSYNCNYYLRIKDHVEINQFEQFNPVKNHFQKVFMNSFNSQEILWKNFSNLEHPIDHQIIIALGNNMEQKTFTIQGFKNNPGLLPRFSQRLNFQENIFVQIFSCEQNLKDYVKIYKKFLKDKKIIKTSNKIYKVQIENFIELNRVFKTILSLIIKQKDNYENLCIRFIMGKRSLTLIDTGSLANNLKIFKINKKVKQKSKNIFQEVFLKNIQDVSKLDLNFVFHIQNINKKQELQQIIKAIEKK